MDGKSESARRQAAREATEWFLLLAEEPDDRDLRRRFQTWHDADPLNAVAWAATERTGQVATAMTPVHAADWVPFVERSRAAGRQGGAAASAWRRRGESPWRGRRWMRPVAALALVACIATFVVPTALLQLRADYVTGTAEMLRLELEDGSRVALAPGSALAVSFQAAERRVRLLAGQAFFQVQPNPQRPFRVQAGSVEASVLGTSFDVRLDPGSVTVSVEEGIVQVSSAVSVQASERLRAGQAVRVTDAGIATRHNEPPQSVAAWRRGQLVSHDQPLRDSVEQLRRYFPGTIVLADMALGDRPVTGVYNLDDPEEALRGIAQAHGGHVRRITPWVLVVSPF